MGEVGRAERDDDKNTQCRGLAIHLRRLRPLLDLCELETANVVGDRSFGRAAQKTGKGCDMSDMLALVLSLKVRIVMSAIMRRRRSLIGLSLIEGSCPEVGVGPSILRTGPLPS